MKLYNTLTQKKEEFVPITPGEVKIYSCGPTVYNFFHIGNARPFIVFDVLRRYFIYKGYKVTFVQNFTDVDDKIINRAAMEHMSAMELSDKYIAEYYIDAEGLGIMKADYHPRVSATIPEIIAMVEKLIEKGHAYESEGNVYYSVASFPDYGKLSKQSMDELVAGERKVVFDATEHKKSPLDFALWKARKEGEQVYWESPWGQGRPGWHIECSAMSCKYLGETIDIHSGGQDLIFPHHENEIAQSEGASGKPFANYWLHNGYINIDNVKMSKSLGNFFTVREIADKFDLEVVRLFIISAHYRSPINFSDEALRQAQSGLERLYNVKYSLEHMLENAKNEKMTQQEHDWIARLYGFIEQFEQAMDDDINSANALSVMYEAAKEINIFTNEQTSAEALRAAYKIYMTPANVLGLLGKEKKSDITDQIKELIQERTDAKKNKNFARADEIRDILLEKGIALKDTREGVVWEYIK